MQLNIPLIFQPPHSVECGAACLAMISEYFGLDNSYHNIKSEINLYEVGSFSFSLCNYLLKQGLDVELVYCNPFLFNLEMGRSGVFSEKQKLIDHIKIAMQKSQTEVWPKIWYNSLPELLEFVELGGQLTIDYPKREHVEKALSKNSPPISVQISQLLNTRSPEQYAISKSRPNSGHFDVITGMEGGTIFVNNPEIFQPD